MDSIILIQSTFIGVIYIYIVSKETKISHRETRLDGVHKLGLSRGEGWDPFTQLNTTTFCACPKTGSHIQRHRW
jgi:hypothetical protein